MQTSLADALKQFLRTSRLGSGLRSVQISEIWEQVMGQTIARSTDKVELVNRTLYISTAVAPLKSELHFSRDLIKRRINEQLGEALVEEVVIR
jgi:hypothetical protein